MTKDPTHTKTEDRPNEADQRRDTGEDQDTSVDVNTPFSPHEEDDSELGDTDQHSTA